MGYSGINKSTELLEKFGSRRRVTPLGARFFIMPSEAENMDELSITVVVEHDGEEIVLHDENGEDEDEQTAAGYIVM